MLLCKLVTKTNILCIGKVTQKLRQNITQRDRKKKDDEAPV